MCRRKMSSFSIVLVALTACSDAPSLATRVLAEEEAAFAAPCDCHKLSTALPAVLRSTARGRSVMTPLIEVTRTPGPATRRAVTRSPTASMV